MDNNLFEKALKNIHTENISSFLDLTINEFLSKKDYNDIYFNLRDYTLLISFLKQITKEIISKEEIDILAIKLRSAIQFLTERLLLIDNDSNDYFSVQELLINISTNISFPLSMIIPNYIGSEIVKIDSRMPKSHVWWKVVEKENKELSKVSNIITNQINTNHLVLSHQLEDNFLFLLADYFTSPNKTEIPDINDEIVLSLIMGFKSLMSTIPNREMSLIYRIAFEYVLITIVPRNSQYVDDVKSIITTLRDSYRVK